MILLEDLKKLELLELFIDKISIDLIFNDYITYYLQKYNSNRYIYNIDDIYHKIIEILIKIRFNSENKIIKKDNKIKILLAKIIWIESNMKFIINIMKIIEKALQIFNDNEIILLNKIDELINKNNIKYITKENRNPLHTKEVNECYYILLASICYCITSDEIELIIDNNKENEYNKIEIDKYYYILKDINYILKNLDADLFIFLNEKYIISELIQIIELFKKYNNIKNINEIRNILRENCFIIQEYAFNKDEFEFNEKIINNFEKLDLMINKIENKDENYYNILKDIYFQEIKKLINIDYRYTIMKKLLKKNEMIKKSIDIFQILLKKYLKIEKIKYDINIILHSDNIILKQLEKELKSKVILEEILLYLFEKNSLIYIQIKNEVNLEQEPLYILKECIHFLEIYMKKPNIFDSKLKELSKLFCIGYIKTYIYTFIKEVNKIKFYMEIIDIINKENSVCKMIRIYIYKILYNKFKMNFFNDENNISKYKLKEFKDFDELKKNIQ